MVIRINITPELHPRFVPSGILRHAARDILKRPEASTASRSSHAPAPSLARSSFASVPVPSAVPFETWYSDRPLDWFDGKGVQETIWICNSIISDHRAGTWMQMSCVNTHKIVGHFVLITQKCGAHRPLLCALFFARTVPYYLNYLNCMHAGSICLYSYAMHTMQFFPSIASLAFFHRPLVGQPILHVPYCGHAQVVPN